MEGLQFLEETLGAIEMMTEAKPERNGNDRRLKLQTLWTFVTLNYVYADVVTLFDKTVVTSRARAFTLTIHSRAE